MNRNKQKQLGDEIQVIGDSISGFANAVRKALKEMETDNKKAAQEGGDMNADMRIRKGQHSTLSRRFVQVMTRYNDVQAENKKKYADQVKRQCKIG